MPKNRYLPTADAEKVAWLANFNSKVNTHGLVLGLTPAEILSVNTDNQLVQYIWTLLNGSRTRMQDITAYKKALFDGPVVPALPSVPGGFTLGSPPALVAPDVFGRLGQLVVRMKAHPAYTTAIGEDLGVEGSADTFDPESLKPIITTRMVGGGQCEVIWTKGRATAIEIEVDRGTGFVFLALDTVPNYLDTHMLPPGTSGLWKYRAIYRIGDNRVGMWSDIVTCAVGG